MKNLLILFTFVLLLQGCANRGTGGSYVGEISTMNVSESIVADVLTFIAEHYPSGHTELSLLTPKENAENDFSLALENALRKQGYTISEKAEITIAYTVDKLADNTYYLQMKLDNFELARLYDVQGYPSSNWTKKVPLLQETSKLME